MTDTDFPRALHLVLVDEGGLDDDPHDHGGRTAHGIIQREYDGFRARKGLQRQDVWKITAAEYTEIYHDQYWEPWCDRLPPGLDYMFFDFAVNAGPVRAVKTLQALLGLRVDGHMGEVVMGKVAAIEDMDAFIHQYADARRRFYRALAQFPRYGRGWLARVDHVERGAQQIAATGEHPVRNGLSDDLRAKATARANDEDTHTTTVAPETAAATAAGAGVSAGIMEQISAATSQLTALQGVVHGVEYILMALALVSVGYGIYSTIHKSKIKAAVA